MFICILISGLVVNLVIDMSQKLHPQVYLYTCFGVRTASSIIHYVLFHDEDGCQVQFWHETWCEDHPLKVLYLHCMHAPQLDMHQFIFWWLDIKTKRWSWKIRFRKYFNNWELELVNYFLERLYVSRMVLRCCRTALLL